MMETAGGKCVQRRETYSEMSGLLVRRRVKDIESNINSEFQNEASDFEWFSLSLSELTAVTDTSQVVHFLRGQCQV